MPTAAILGPDPNNPLSMAVQQTVVTQQKMPRTADRLEVYTFCLIRLHIVPIYIDFRSIHVSLYSSGYVSSNRSYWDSPSFTLRGKVPDKIQDVLIRSCVCVRNSLSSYILLHL